MANQLLPRSIDNRYSGHKLAPWLLGLVASVRIVQSLTAIFNGYSVLSSADGIPLDSYAPASARTIVSVWALSALFRLIISLQCVVVLVRYRAAIPLMFAVLVVEGVARQLVLQFVPLTRIGHPIAPVAHLILLVFAIVGLGLALWKREDRPGPTPTP